MFIDTHCHIDLFPSPEYVVRSVETRRIFILAVSNTPAMYLESIKQLIGNRYIQPALGIHPGVLVKQSSLIEKQFRAAIVNANFIGEIGLDGILPNVPIRRQLPIFHRVLEECKPQACVLSVHSRRAEKLVLDHLDTSFHRPVILHWFTGPESQLLKAVAAGHYFSINLQMLSSKLSDRYLKAIPLDRVLTESDGPYAMYDDRPCGPLDIPKTVELLASRYGIPCGEMEMQIQQNFERLLSLNGLSDRWKHLS